METAVKRTMLDLYKPLLKIFEEKHTLFICKAISINRMGFCSIHKVKLKNHFLTQFPSEIQYTEFYNNPLFYKADNIANESWFTYKNGGRAFVELVESESFKIRVKFLEAIIENLEKNPELNLVL